MVLQFAIFRLVFKFVALVPDIQPIEIEYIGKYDLLLVGSGKEIGDGLGRHWGSSRSDNSGRSESGLGSGPCRPSLLMTGRKHMLGKQQLECISKEVNNDEDLVEE
jgi:hypothetical protein